MAKIEEVKKEIPEVMIPESCDKEYFLPAGIFRIYKAHLKWWGVPYLSKDCCCCCCCCPAPGPAPMPAPAPAPAPSITVQLNLAVGRFGPGKAIHIVYVTTPAQYFAEAFIQWNASGGSGQLQVDLEVQRPGSTTFQTLASNRGPNDEYLFGTNIPGTYLFRATAKDSAGKSSFNTLSVTFPRI